MSKRKTTEEFIAEAKLVHGNKYDYSKVNYVNSRTKVIITCLEHGDFIQQPSMHTSGQGCPKCGNINKGSSKLITLKEVLIRAHKVHNNKYNYDSISYTRVDKKMNIICPIHGKFEQRVADHLNGIGCPYCSSNSRSNTKEFINKAIAVHGLKYNYSLVEYTTNNKPLSILCYEHGKFIQRASHHLSGRGCPSCAKNGFQPNKPAILYYLKITTDTNQVLYKIGITNRTVNERFNLTDLSKIEIVKQKLYDNGQDALDWETKLKRIYKEHQYKGPDILSSGNTELFTEDIIAMWDSN